MRPHRQQPTRLPRPWNSPGKNTGVGCHFLLQCMKVKSESEVAQSCRTLSDPMDCSPPGSSIHGIFQAGVLEWGAIAFSEMYTSGIIKCSLDQKAKNPAQESQRPCVIWPTPSPVSSFTLLFSFPEPLQSFLPQDLLSVTVLAPSPAPSPPNSLLTSFKPPLEVTFWENTSLLFQALKVKELFSVWLALQILGFLRVGPALLTTTS